MQTVPASKHSSIMVFLDIFVSPKSVFERLPSIKKLSLIAFIVLCALVFLSEYMFYNSMTPEWLVSQQIQFVGDELPEAERKMVSQILLDSAGSVGALNGTFSVISQLLFVLILSIYFFVIAKIYKH